MRNLGPGRQFLEIQDRQGPEPTKCSKSWTGTGPRKIWKSRTGPDPT